MGGLGSGDHRGVCNKGEMDAGIWDQVGLEFGKINIQGAIKAKGGSDGRNNCSQR